MYFSLWLVYLFSAEIINYEAYVFMGEQRWSFSLLLQWRRKKVKIHPFFILLVFQYFPFPPKRQYNKHQPISHKKGFINYVFCRNWAIRNPAWNRPYTYSLVNKEVDRAGPLITDPPPTSSTTLSRKETCDGLRPYYTMYR